MVNIYNELLQRLIWNHTTVEQIKYYINAISHTVANKTKHVYICDVKHHIVHRLESQS